MINILFAGNDKVFDGILTCMLSIFMRTSTREPFSIYILTMDVSHIKPQYRALTEEQAQVLNSVAADFNPDNRVTRIDVIEKYNACFASCPSETA